MSGHDVPDTGWQPDERRMQQAVVTRYLAWLTWRGELNAATYPELWRWSVEQNDLFWASLWDFFEVQPARRGPVPSSPVEMLGGTWFPGEKISYSRTALRHPDEAIALIVRDEAGTRRTTTYGELRSKVATAAVALRELGVEPGDRVAAVLPNGEEAVVAFLATASLGAIWTLCAPEYGADSIVARFAQTEPTVLLTVDAYRYAGKTFDIRAKLDAVTRRLSTLTHRIEVRSGLVDVAEEAPRHWDEFVGTDTAESFEPLEVDFDHPLWILYSSGTTGVPKAMVHGHGGIVLEHLKSLSLHNDIEPGDVLFWYTSTAWMMWNYIVGALLCGAATVIYDGAADPGLLWQIAADEDVTLLGASPGFFQQSLDRGLPAEAITRLRTLGSTGSPLLPETQRRLSERLPHVQIASVSGGTDVCSGFVGPSPILPVRTGWMQCRMLGVDCAAFDSEGNAVVGEIGALVVRAPMPSMPLRFWGDQDGKRYHESYFTEFPGVWSHGDWIMFDADGQAMITGRSDATLNRGGVRMGTSEFYRVVEEVPWIEDSLVVDTSGVQMPDGKLVLFAVVDGAFDDDRRKELTTAIRSRISPRHVPDLVVPVPVLPYTLTGKKCEIPVKRMLLGAEADEVADPDSLRDPSALEDVVRAAREWMEALPK